MAFTQTVISVNCSTCSKKRNVLVDNSLVSQIKSSAFAECPECFVRRKGPEAQRLKGSLEGLKQYLTEAIR